MSKKFNLDEYATVDERLEAYITEFPEHTVITELLHYSDDNTVVIKASIYRSKEDVSLGIVHATGIAEENTIGYVNETSRVENCETSAIGRALANAGFKAKKGGASTRPSREEMAKVQRLAEAKKVVETKTPEPRNDSGAASTLGMEDIESKLRSFTSTTDLVQWFNAELKSRSGAEKDEFKAKYHPIAQQMLEQLT